MAKINVRQTSITILQVNEKDYISLTDIARHKSDDPTAVIGNWMRNRNTIEYLGIWPYTIRVSNSSNSRGLEEKPV